MEWDVVVATNEVKLRSLRKLQSRAFRESPDHAAALNFFLELSRVSDDSLKPAKPPRLLRTAAAVAEPARPPNPRCRWWWNRKRSRMEDEENADELAGISHQPGASYADVLCAPCEADYNAFLLDPASAVEVLTPEEMDHNDFRGGQALSSHYLTGVHEREKLNQKFHQRHPGIQPTMSLTKLRSLKRVLFRLMKTEEATLDLTAVACAWVYFERLALGGWVNKTNRRTALCACIILGVKYNQDEKFDLERIQRLVCDILPNQFDQTVSPKDIVKLEFEVFAALNFDLGVSREEAEPHILQFLRTNQDVAITVSDPTITSQRRSHLIK